MNHYCYIDRYPDGLDATVYMDDNYVQDMSFRNDTEHPIVIRGFGGNGFVTFQIWSVPHRSYGRHHRSGDEQLPRRDRDDRRRSEHGRRDGQQVDSRTTATT